MSESLVWWLTTELIGVAAFPIAFLFFRFLPDRGYGFSKAFGLLLLSYSLWVGASTHVIPNRRWAIVLLLVLITVASAATAISRRRELTAFLRARWRHLAAMEALFTAVFFFALILRSYSAELGFVEQPYDFAYINAIIRSDYFPAADPWLSGHSIPLYHFGHLVVATLTKLTDIPSRITINLALASVVALTFSGAFGLVYNLVARRCSFRGMLAYGLLGAFLLAVMGNLEGFFELLAAHGVGSLGFYETLDIAGLDGPRSSTAWYPTEWNWYGRAVQIAGGPAEREFPFFSFLQGFVHGHSLALPFLLMGTGVALNVWLGPGSLGRRRPLSLILGGVAMALTLGAIGFTNIWNYPPAVLLFVIAALARDCVGEKPLPLATLARTSAFIIAVVVLSAVLYLPFYIGLDPAGSFAILEARGSTVLDLQVTMPHHLVYIWLPFLWLTAFFAAAALAGIKPNARWAALATIPVLVPLAVWAAALIVSRGSAGLLDEVDARSQGWITFLALATLLGALSLAFVSHVRARQNSSAAQAAPFALLVAAVALLLMLGMEFFWYHDLWGTRSTTLLKLGYHAWVLLSISGAFGAHYLLSAWRPSGLPQQLGRAAWLAATALLLLAASVFPVTSTFSRTNGFDNERHLDALVLVRIFEPDESDASEWLWREVKGTPVILEAVGDSFTGFARVSSRTGLPTVLGWPWHEHLWRGSLAPQAGRMEDVARAYMTTDADEARSILDRYDVEYVYVGSLERLQYGEAGLAKFGSFMDVAFRSGQVTIFKTREPDRRTAPPSACCLSTRKPAMLH